MDKNIIVLIAFLMFGLVMFTIGLVGIYFEKRKKRYMPKTRKQIENFPKDLQKDINGNFEYHKGGGISTFVSEKMSKRAVTIDKIKNKAKQKKKTKKIVWINLFLSYTTTTSTGEFDLFYSKEEADASPASTKRLACVEIEIEE